MNRCFDMLVWLWCNAGHPCIRLEFYYGLCEKSNAHAQGGAAHDQDLAFLSAR